MVRQGIDASRFHPGFMIPPCFGAHASLAGQASDRQKPRAIRNRDARLASHGSCRSAAKRQLVFALLKRCAVMETAAHIRNIRSGVAVPERPLRIRMVVCNFCFAVPGIQHSRRADSRFKCSARQRLQRDYKSRPRRSVLSGGFEYKNFLRANEISRRSRLAARDQRLGGISR